MEPGDEILVEQALSGNADSFSILVKRYQSTVFALALAMTKNAEDARDLTQESFIKAYANLSTLKEPSKFANWLKSITRSICAQWLRDTANRRSLLTHMRLKSPKTPEDLALEKELREIISAALEALPEKLRLTTSLYYADGLSYNEIASFQGVPVTTVKSRLYESRERLKAMLAKEAIAIMPEVLKSQTLKEDVSDAKNSDVPPVIKVIGVGGGGGNAVKHMISANLGEIVDLYIVDTDHDALAGCHGAEKVKIGANTTVGLDTGGDPEVGKRAAEEDRDKLEGIIGDDADVVFIIATMGGGTGAGVAPMIAKHAKDKGVLTIGLVTKPFLSEGQRRMRKAEKGITALKEYADLVMVVSNQRFIEQIGRNTPIPQDFRIVDNVWLQGVKTIYDMMAIPGEIALSFDEFKTIMSGAGSAVIGAGIGQGYNRAETAAKNALACPMLEEENIKGATDVLIGIRGGLDMTTQEVRKALDIIYHSAAENVHVIFGLLFDEELRDKIQVTVIATGFDEQHLAR